jgi:hypothetical protein
MCLMLTIVTDDSCFRSLFPPWESGSSSFIHSSSACPRRTAGQLSPHKRVQLSLPPRFPPLAQLRLSTAHFPAKRLARVGTGRTGIVYNRGRASAKGVAPTKLLL